MKIAVIGSREFRELDLVKKLVFAFPRNTVLISGGAYGPDAAAETAAKEYKLDRVIFEPKWNKHGRGAGIIRNTLIIEAAQRVYAFWDGASNGTRDSIGKARDQKKPVVIIQDKQDLKRAVDDIKERIFCVHEAERKRPMPVYDFLQEPPESQQTIFISLCLCCQSPFHTTRATDSQCPECRG